MSIRRRMCLFAGVLALASMVSGCVEITNPQFDARYRVAVHPVGKPALAVFAVHDTASAASTGGGDPVRVVVMDTASDSSVATVPLEGVVSLSDVGIRHGRPKLLATLATGFVEIDLASHEVTPVPVTRLAQGAPRRAAFDASGIPVLWQTSADGTRLLVSRGGGSNEQTAVLDPRRQAVASFRTLDGAALVLSAANSAGASFYYVDAARSMAARSVTPWRADFRRHDVMPFGRSTPWPVGLNGPLNARFDRAVAQSGQPMQLPGGVAAFRVEIEASGVPTLSVLPTSPVLFEPGGERYLEVRHSEGSAAWAVVERSLVSTRASTVYREEVPSSGLLALDPLGYVGGRFAYTQVHDARRDAAGVGAPFAAPYEADLHLYDPVTRADTTVLSVPVVDGVGPQIEFLGSFTR